MAVDRIVTNFVVFFYSNGNGWPTFKDILSNENYSKIECP